MPVAVVTDSTAYLPAGLARARAVTIVPLYVVINGVERREGVDVSPADVATVLRTRRADVTTSRPAPADFLRTYRELLTAGADSIVSVHLSQHLSGTYQAASLVSAEFGGRVSVVDSGATGMGLGFPVLAAAAAAASGAPADEVHRAAADAADRTSTLFYVDTLEFLRRGGRIGAASALVGTALSVKPILHMAGGSVRARDKVRTASRALARLVDLAVQAAGESEVHIAVHHLAAAERAEAMLSSLVERLGDRVRERHLIETGAAVAAHVGPGFVGVVVYRRH